MFHQILQAYDWTLYEGSGSDLDVVIDCKARNLAWETHHVDYPGGIWVDHVLNNFVLDSLEIRQARTKELGIVAAKSYRSGQNRACWTVFIDDQEFKKGTTNEADHLLYLYSLYRRALYASYIRSNKHPNVGIQFKLWGSFLCLEFMLLIVWIQMYRSNGEGLTAIRIPVLSPERLWAQCTGFPSQLTEGEYWKAGK